MTARITLERVLRDDDDHTGQSIRQWHIQKEGDILFLRPREGSDFITLRSPDIKQLNEDLIAVDGATSR